MQTVMYNLLKSPHTLKKLVRELEEADVSRPYPKWTEVSTLPYLDACVLEALRVHPPFALPFERVVPEGGITMLGHFLPAGTIVGASPYVTNRCKTMYGEDAEFWRPERWLEGDAEHKKKMENVMLTVSQDFMSLSRRCRLTLSFPVWRWPAYLPRTVYWNF